ncbi:MAG: hypothetical protein N4A74_14115 [Carboxylicivirga sp.]|jgi:hypothetical protein|nr:hypothetical protein [Carboxylicivirga sp.]
MFGTVIIDAYRKEETNEIATALEDITSPKDSYGWASAGIYCFWDYYSEAILYIGLASDLCERLKQHNGILPVDASSCKIEQINKYFESNERLGYSIFVQSPLSQPLTHRNKKMYQKIAEETDSPIEDMISEQGRDDIKKVEGILIEAFKREYGIFPPWNKVGGSISGQSDVRPNNINIVKSFCTPDNYARNPIVSRSTLRELSENPTFLAFENDLHAVRMNMMLFGMDYPKALEVCKRFDTYGSFKRIEDNNYMKKRLIV